MYPHHCMARGECILYSRLDWILDEIFRVASDTLHSRVMRKNGRERRREWGVCVCVCVWYHFISVYTEVVCCSVVCGLLGVSAPWLDALSIITDGTELRGVIHTSSLFFTESVQYNAGLLSNCLDHDPKLLSNNMNNVRHRFTSKI